MKTAGNLLLLAAGLAIVQPALSQVSVYVDFSASKLTGNSAAYPAAGQLTNVLYGPTVGVTKSLVGGHHLFLAADIRGTFTGGSGQRMDGVVVGPRVAIPVKKFAPYIEGMVGFARYNDGRNTSVSSTTDAQIQINSGIDYQVSKQFDWRAFEYGYEQFYGIGGNFNPKTFSTGIVYHIGGR
ncbi:hypothetical protein SAMN05421770_101700 [Granulicella rosea]|uniref:Outer membrane protein beta-barrel domain-containing protein n=1 Tax=Granulicella rosea TaxID=474952 RepID=A0A239DXG3_9BACT|nr:hypothetical protein [Granulicella rosea]SNS37215.1 hypothetical protein SAMN05421770_101700 [Granulicella rosea]